MRNRLRERSLEDDCRREQGTPYDSDGCVLSASNVSIEGMSGRSAQELIAAREAFGCLETGGRSKSKNADVHAAEFMAGAGFNERIAEIGTAAEKRGTQARRSAQVPGGRHSHARQGKRGQRFNIALLGNVRTYW
jgi:hypothetical protein